MTEVRRSYCGLCHPRCGTLLHIEDGRLVKVTGDPDHPVTRGAICERGRLMPDHVNHPDRLNYPLKRVGEKGGGRWQRLTWDQALDEVAEKLAALRDRHGPETLAFTHGTKRTHHWDQRRFFNLFGSPNTCGANNICMCPSYATDYATLGGMVWSEIMGAKCVVNWGSNTSKSGPTGRHAHIVRAKKQGAKLIVVDPRRIKEAEMADLWLQIRPGTDAAMMLGWIRLIIEEELYDRDFVTNWTVGFRRPQAGGRPVHSGKGLRDHHGSGRPHRPGGPDVREHKTGRAPLGIRPGQVGRQRHPVRPGPGHSPGHYRQSGSAGRRHFQPGRRGGQSPW